MKLQDMFVLEVSLGRSLELYKIPFMNTHNSVIVNKILEYHVLKKCINFLTTGRQEI